MGLQVIQCAIECCSQVCETLLESRNLVSASPEALRCYAIVVRYVLFDGKTARAFVDAYDPGYTPEARAKLDELKKELAKLP